MIVSILAPSSADAMCKAAGLDETIYFARVAKIAEMLAEKGFELLLVPQKNSVSEFIAKKTIESNGVCRTFVLKDNKFDLKKFDADLAAEKVDNIVLINRAFELVKKGDFILVLGFSAGTVTELGFGKFFNKKIIVVNDFVSGSLPKEFEQHLNIEYVDFNNLEKKLDKLKGGN